MGDQGRLRSAHEGRGCLAERPHVVGIDPARLLGGHELAGVGVADVQHRDTGLLSSSRATSGGSGMGGRASASLRTTSPDASRRLRARSNSRSSSCARLWSGATRLAALSGVLLSNDRFLTLPIDLSFPCDNISAEGSDGSFLPRSARACRQRQSHPLKAHERTPHHRLAEMSRILGRPAWGIARWLYGRGVAEDFARGQAGQRSLTTLMPLRSPPWQPTGSSPCSSTCTPAPWRA
jgi:hypothetical protein